MKTQASRFHRRARKSRRTRGAAIVELAVSLPVVMLIVLGAMESAGMIFLKQALVQTAYEGVKVAAKRSGDETTARQAASAVTDGRNLEGVKIEFEPQQPGLVERGQIIRVKVSAPADENTLIGFGIFRGQEVVVEASMIKE